MSQARKKWPIYLSRVRDYWPFHGEGQTPPSMRIFPQCSKKGKKKTEKRMPSDNGNSTKGQRVMKITHYVLPTSNIIRDHPFTI